MNPWCHGLTWGLVLIVSPLTANGDCNANGTPDAVDIASATSADCNGNETPDECEHEPFHFEQIGGSIAAPSVPRVIRSGDIDGDGDLDMVVISRLATSVLQILFNVGGGQFSTPLTFAVPGKLFSVVLSDVNDDGSLDLVSGKYEEIAVQLNDGQGNFGESTLYATSGNVRFVTAGDVTGDGHPDILATNRRQPTISLLEGDGTGALAAPVDITVANDPVVISTADLDHDGDLDVVAVSHAQVHGEISVLLNDGAGTFGPAERYSIGAEWPTTLDIADLDGDATADLVVTTPRHVVVFLNGGSGAFLDPVTHDGIPIIGFASVDADGDGDQDLAIGGPSMNFEAGGALTVRLNDGSGDFGAVTQFDHVEPPTLLEPGDFDNDGTPDLALATRVPWALAVLRNVHGRMISLRRELKFPLEGCYREDHGCHPHSGDAVDIDGDGDLDVIGCNTHPGSFTLLLNDGSGVLTQQPAYNFASERPIFMAIGDLDGDGDPDAVTVDNWQFTVAVHLNAGDGTFSDLTVYFVEVGGLDVELADLDRDGTLDVITANQSSATVSVLFNLGDGALVEKFDRDYAVARGPRSLDAADFDGDGTIDIAVANGDNTVSVLPGDGTGRLAAPVEIRLPGSPNHVSSADLDDDGDLDLLTANRSRSSVSILRNRGDGTFASPAEVFLAHAPYSVTAVDFDSDGVLDLVVPSEASSLVSFLFGRGDGTFPGSPVNLRAGDGLRFVFPGDFDEDGDIDLVTNDRQGKSFTVIYNDLAAPSPDYLESICTPWDYSGLSAESSGSARRFVKYTLAAVVGGGPFPSAVFQHSRRFELHQDFLESTFPDGFPSLEPAVYDALVGRRATREYFVGTVSRFRSDEGLVYGFSVVSRWDDAVERLSAAEVKSIHDRLRESFLLEPFGYLPGNAAAAEVARGWTDPGFRIFEVELSLSDRYAAYTRAVGYGRVRILSRDAFESANDIGEISFQDVLVLDHAPRDIEGVVGGLVTSEPQGELSHVAVRTNRRGTPNAFLASAHEKFAPYAGKLVRLEVGAVTHCVREAKQEEAEEFWLHNRPGLSVVPTLDSKFGEFSTLEEIASMEASGEANVVSRFGGKAANLARLQWILEGEYVEYRERGIGIPVRHYLEFMRSNVIESAFDDSRQVSYEGYVEELLASQTFRGDPTFRFETLGRLREAMNEQSEVSEDLVIALASEVERVFQSTTSRVRFRSSSTIEDVIEFNGAGLYDSTSACVADDLDDDTRGPSLCDQTRGNERGIARALRKVWASLWNFRAYEERAYYSVPEELAAMGVLVNRAFVDERANGVAFTGFPSNRLDRRYVITAQVGEESVVSPDPGVLPEKSIVEVLEGEVVRIVRAVPSSLVGEGEFVLTAAELEELGRLLWYMDGQFPLETGDHAREDVLLDVEFKIESSGELAVKQVRPFLLTEPERDTPTFELVIPEGTSGCGLFNIGREVTLEYELKSMVHLVGGNYALPSSLESFPGSLVEAIELGPERELATPTAPGLFTVLETVSSPGCQDGSSGSVRVTYHFDYRQELELGDGRRFDFELSASFETEDGVPVVESLVLDSEALTDVVRLTGGFPGGDGVEAVVYTSCTHETLPLWEIRAALADGGTVSLDGRLRRSLELDFAPASIVGARVNLGLERRVVNSYWDLVYSAVRHNEREVYWTVFDPPTRVPGIEWPVYGLELRAPEGTEELAGSASYLGADLEELARVDVVSFIRLEAGAETWFRRGDADGNGTMTIGDASSLLNFLFLRGPEPPCMKSADAVDDGALDTSDAVAILHTLFPAGGPRQSLFGPCGPDPTPDPLSCRMYRPCEDAR